MDRHYWIENLCDIAWRKCYLSCCHVLLSFRVRFSWICEQKNWAWYTAEPSKEKQRPREFALPVDVSLKVSQYPLSLVLLHKSPLNTHLHKHNEKDISPETCTDLAAVWPQNTITPYCLCLHVCVWSLLLVHNLRVGGVYTRVLALVENNENHFSLSRFPFLSYTHTHVPQRPDACNFVSVDLFTSLQSQGYMNIHNQICT